MPARHQFTTKRWEAPPPPWPLTQGWPARCQRGCSRPKTSTPPPTVRGNLSEASFHHVEQWQALWGIGYIPGMFEPCAPFTNCHQCSILKHIVLCSTENKTCQNDHGKVYCSNILTLVSSGKHLFKAQRIKHLRMQHSLTLRGQTIDRNRCKISSAVSVNN